MRPRYHIFLSYRRDDGKDIARTIKEKLVQKGYSVFFDLDELQDGVFDERILAAIDEAPIYMLLMTEHCFDRCHNADDWVRQEIEHAVRQGKTIIPVIPDRQFVDYPDTMPLHLQEALKTHQYSAIDTNQLYQESIDKLVKERIQPIIGFKHKALVWAIILFLVTLVPYYVAYYHILPQYYLNRGDKILAADSLTQADTLKAIQYYHHAIDARNIEGYGKLGTIYYKGVLDHRERFANNDTALMYFRKGAYAGDGYAQTRLALCLKDKWVLGGFKTNFDSAFYWAETAYRNGYYEGAATLATMYNEGISVEKDDRKAEKLFREAIRNEDFFGGIRDDLSNEFDLGMILRWEENENYNFVEGTSHWINAYKRGNALAQLLLQSDKYWIFNPQIDSVSNTDLHITAISHDQKDTMCMYCEWYNRSDITFLKDSTLGGWIQIDRHAFIENPYTGEHYPISALENCKFAPDTTIVKWHDVHKFVLCFANVPDTLTRINFCESDTSDWRFYGIHLNDKITIAPLLSK